VLFSLYFAHFFIVKLMRSVIFLIKHLCMYNVQDEETQVCGVVVIENMADVGLVHAWNMDHRAAKLFTSLIQVSFPHC